MNERIGGWFQTVKGRKFYLLDPYPEDFDIEEIAHALSMLCRYGGHCLRFYSTAEHCVLMAQKAPEVYKRAALLHDGYEGCGLNDLITPIKRHLPEYQSAEARGMRALSTRFKFEWPCAAVAELDTRILLDEREQNMATPPGDWHLGDIQPLGVTLRFWTPLEAERAFLAAYYAYGGSS